MSSGGHKIRPEASASKANPSTTHFKPREFRWSIVWSIQLFWKRRVSGGIHSSATEADSTVRAIFHKTPLATFMFHTERWDRSSQEIRSPWASALRNSIGIYFCYQMGCTPTNLLMLLGNTLLPLIRDYYILLVPQDTRRNHFESHNSRYALNTPCLTTLHNNPN